MHGPGDYGFIPILIAAARKHGVSAYIGDGAQRWPAIHRLDAATLFRLALEQAPARSALHGAAESGVTITSIAEQIGRSLGLPVVSLTPEQALDHFDNPFMATALGTDAHASSVHTQTLLGWTPTHPTLLEDLATGDYFPRTCMSDEGQDTTLTVRFHEYGEPGDVLHLETVPVPAPGRGRIRVAVHASGLNPADWALCRGLFPGTLPRGIGIDVSGSVEAVGDGVTPVGHGENVLGADWAGAPLAGASDPAIMDHWAAVPPGRDLAHAAALPMALETAYRSLDQLGLSAEHTVLVHGAGTTVGFAAVQIALIRGARVVATAGETYAQRLRDFGAVVTGYGAGMVERVAAGSEGSIDVVLDTAPVSGVLPDLVRLAGGDPRRVLTVTDMAGAEKVGARSSVGEDRTLRFDVFPEFAQLAAAGRFTVPIAQTFPLEDWRAALGVSEGGQARGKLLLLPGEHTSGAWHTACSTTRGRGSRRSRRPAQLIEPP